MKRQAFTLIELMVVVLIIGLLIAILLPSLGEAMEAGRRVQCAANLNGFGKAFKIYEQNNNVYPALDRGKNFDGTVSTADTIDTNNSLWLMVTSGKSSADMFICPSDTAGAVAFKCMSDKGPADANSPFPIVKGDGTADTNGGKRSWSYSYQVPNGLNGIANPGTPSSNPTKFAIMSDRAPFNEGTDPDCLKLIDDAAFSANGALAFSDVASARNRLSKNPTQASAVNSPNHAGKGQNVLFQDGHCKWMPDPWCGINDDNIFTVATADSESGRVLGAKITATGSPFSADDSILVNVNRGTFCSKTNLDGHK